MATTRALGVDGAAVPETLPFSVDAKAGDLNGVDITEGVQTDSAENSSFSEPQIFTGESVFERDSVELATLKVIADGFNVGAGWRGGPVNWFVVYGDLLGAGNALLKFVKGETLDETDKITLGGYFEGSLRAIPDNPLVKLISKLVGSDNLNFEAGASPRIVLRGDGKGGLELDKISILTIGVLPQTGPLSPGSYRDFGGPGTTHTWTFGKDGRVDYSSAVFARTGSFGKINGNREANAGDLPVPTSVARGLNYGLLFEEVNEAEDVSLLARQFANHLPGDGQVAKKALDTANYVKFFGSVFNSIAGDENLDPDGDPEVSGFRGWTRFVLPLDAANKALPESVPAFGLAVEVGGQLIAVEDGNPEIELYTSASSEPVATVSTERLKNAWQSLSAKVEDAANNIKLSFFNDTADVRNRELPGFAVRQNEDGSPDESTLPVARFYAAALETDGITGADATARIQSDYDLGGRELLIQRAASLLAQDPPAGVTAGTFRAAGFGESAARYAAEAYQLLIGPEEKPYRPDEAWNTVISIYLRGFSGGTREANLGLKDGGGAGGFHAIRQFHDSLKDTVK